MMNVVDAISLLAVGVILLLGFATVAFQMGFWTGLAVVLICFGVMLIGTGITYQIANAPACSRKPSFEDRAFSATLLSCQACGLQISEDVERCPRCDHPNLSFNSQYDWIGHLLWSLCEILIWVFIVSL
jgi:hypothetical protein